MAKFVTLIKIADLTRGINTELIIEGDVQTVADGFVDALCENDFTVERIRAGSLLSQRLNAHSQAQTLEVLLLAKPIHRLGTFTSFFIENEVI